MTTTLRGQFKQLASWNGQFIHPEATSVSDSARETMPTPLTWTSGFAKYWSPFSIGVDNYTGGAGPLVARSNWSGATLCTPLHCFVANHSLPADGAVAGTGTVFFLQGDGTEISREVVSSTNISGDLSIATLNSPITTITPIAVAADSSQLAGCSCAFVETNRHVNVCTLASNTTNSLTATHASMISSDEAEGGDSAKACIAVFGDTPIAVMTAIYLGGATAVEGPNPSYYQTELDTFLSGSGYSLTLVDLVHAADNARASMSASCSPLVSATQYHPALIGN